MKENTGSIAVKRNDVRILSFLRKYGISVRQLSARAGVSPTTIKRIIEHPDRKTDLYVGFVLQAIHLSDIGDKAVIEQQTRFEKAAKIISEIPYNQKRKVADIMPASAWTAMQSGAYIGTENLYRLGKCFPVEAERVKEILGFYNPKTDSMKRLVSNYSNYVKKQQRANQDHNIAVLSKQGDVVIKKGENHFVIQKHNGDREWFYGKNRDRAVVDADGVIWMTGKRHRADGPAIEKINGSNLWYFNDKLHRKDGPAINMVDGHREWWLHGKRHRLDGPAVENPCGKNEWWIYGVQQDNSLDKEDQPRVEWREQTAKVDDEYSEFFRQSLNDPYVKYLHGAKTVLCERASHNARVMSNGKGEFRLDVNGKDVGILMLNQEKPVFNGSPIDLEDFKSALVKIVASYT